MVTILCAGTIGGVALSRVSLVFGGLYLLAGIILAALAFYFHRAWMVVLALGAGVLIGLWRGGVEIGDLANYNYLYGKTVQLEGKISEDPEQKSGKLSLKISNVTIQGRQYAGLVYVTAGVDAALVRRDDRLQLQGKLVQGKGTTIATMYDAKLIKITRPPNMLLDIRDRFGATIKRLLQEPLASLGLGLLLGQKSQLPPDFSDALKVAGLTHIVVASGYNLTILVRLARRLFEKLSRYQALLWGVIMIIGFMAITGWSASMTRAGLVAGLSLWAWYIGRRFHPVTLLLLAAAVTSLAYPPYAWNDVGWSLSFAAFAGVLLLAPLMQAYFYGTEKPRFVVQLLIETIAAQLATLPIMLGIFGKFSVIALLGNIAVLPLVPLAMLLTFVAGLAGIFVPLAAGLLALPAQFLLGYFVGVINWTAHMPWAQVSWALPPWGVALSYIGMVALVYWLWRVTKYRLLSVNVVE